jgi:membrane protease subunit HflC
MKPGFFFIGVAAVIGLFLLASSAYTVGEQEQVIITQFGKPVGSPINSDPQKNESGLHFKSPFVHVVNRFEKRTLEWDGPATPMPTRDKLTIVVDAFARWRIADPLKYFQNLRDERSALSRLNDTVGNAIRSVVAQHDLVEVIRTDKTRTGPPVEAAAAAAPGVPVAPVVVPVPIALAASPGTLPKIKFGRAALEKEVFDQAYPAVQRMGIELLDVQFKRINYNPSVSEKIYERMISERQQIAESFRSDGAGEAAKIQGRREKELQQIESEAYRKVQELKGRADAQATEIYSKAYNTSPVAADFYRFLKTLETYKTTLGSDTTLILTTDSDFFGFLKSTDGVKPSRTPASPAAPARNTLPSIPAPLPPPSAPPTPPAAPQ